MSINLHKLKKETTHSAANTLWTRYLCLVAFEVSKFSQFSSAIHFLQGQHLVKHHRISKLNETQHRCFSLKCRYVPNYRKSEKMSIFLTPYTAQVYFVRWVFVPITHLSGLLVIPQARFLYRFFSKWKLFILFYFQKRFKKSRHKKIIWKETGLKKTYNAICKPVNCRHSLARVQTW